MEVKESGLSTADCKRWVFDFAIAHLLLRDDGQVQTLFSTALYDILVLDQDLRITYRAAHAASPNVQAAVIGELAKLIP